MKTSDRKALLCIWSVIGICLYTIAVRSDSDTAKFIGAREITIKARFPAGFGKLFEVDGRVIKKRLESIRTVPFYVFFEKGKSPDPDNLNEGVEVSFATPRLREQFEALFKASPDKVYKFTAFETFTGRGAPEFNSTLLAQDFPPDIPPWEVVSMLVIYKIGE